MKIEVKVSELVKKLQRSNDVIASKPAMPILGYVKVDVVSQDRATLTANDLAASITQDLAITLSSDDYEPVLLPAAKLLLIAGQLPSDAMLSITTDGEKPLKLKTKGYKADLPFQSTADFRVLETTPTATIKFSNSALRKLIDRVESASPSKEQKHAVASVLLEGDGKNLQAVATDGFRIAIAQANDATTGTAFSVQIPKTMLAIIKNITGDQLEFSASETNFFFRTATELVVVAKPTTKFPNWQKALALDDFKTSAVVPAVQLKIAVDLAAVTSDAKRPSVIVESNTNQLVVTSASAEGNSNVEVDGTISGELIWNKVRLNQSFLQDFLSNSDGQITMKMKDSRSFVKLTSGSDYIYLVMPLLMETPKEAPAPAKA